MRRFICAAALAAAAGCGSESIPPPRQVPTVDWSLTSTDGRFQVEQSREGPDCRVEARVLPNRRLWTSRTCVRPGAVAFLSPDGRRMLVLDLSPAGQDGDLSDATLVSLWADGAVLREYHGAEVLGAAWARGQRTWLRGSSVEAVRAEARPSPEGETIQLELADGRIIGLGFDGGPLPAPQERPAAVVAGEARPEPPSSAPQPTGAPALEPAPARATAAGKAHQPGRRPPAAAERLPPPPRDAAVTDRLAGDEVGLYRWEDDSGALHFGSGSQIPARYRRRAVPVSASVGVMPVDRQPEPPPAAPAAPGAAPGPGATAPAPAAAPAATPPPAQEATKPR